MKITFFGAGNMGGTIIKAIANDERFDITIVDPCKEKTLNFINSLPRKANYEADTSKAINGADIVFVCVKPNMVESLLKSLKESNISKDTVIVSIAAGVHVEKFTNILPNKVVRTIPNLPAMVMAGITGIYFHGFSENDSALKDAILDIFKSFGEAIVFPKEEYIDKMIPVTSSSPAYVCLFIEALADGAVELGFTRPDAYKMAAQAVMGSAKYILDTGVLPAEMKDRVCSPAGTTIEAVIELEKNNFRYAVIEAMKRCDEKTRGLGK